METRKSTIITILVLIVLAGGAYLALNNPFRTGAGIVDTLAKSFLEDLQFKDFRESALYSHPLDQDRLDIGKTLERLFQVRPEFLDIMDYRIVRTDIDESGKRAKVLVKTRYKVLNKPGKNEPKEADLILYWLKRHPDCPQGGSCPLDTCLNEQGAVMYKPVVEDNPRPHSTRRKDDPALASDEAYACDASKEEEWFMNLDSSLKAEDYRDAEKE